MPLLVDWFSDRIQRWVAARHPARPPARPRRAQTLVGGEVIFNVHDPALCAGKPCCIHNPSDHHMRDWPQHWRGDRGLMERICPDNGIGHPDPDDINPHHLHGCDGCCRPVGLPFDVVPAEAQPW